MKRSGSVTVFLALVITCCSALICALTESARTAGARFYVRTMADAAVDSLFSQYHCQLWECYRLLGYPYESDEKSAQELMNFMKPYVENCGWYAVSAPSANLAEKTFLTDGGGVWFEQEIIDYLTSGWITLDLTPASAEQLWKQLTEAKTMNSIIRDYGGQSREAVAMEKAAGKVEENIRAQNEKKRSAREQLANGENTSFQTTAQQMEITVLALPDLIRKFDEKADRFGVKLDELEARNAEKLSSLEPENRQMVEEEIARLREYTDENGPRRLELDKLDDNNENEISSIDAVCEEADRLEEYLEEREGGDGDDEDEEDSEESLWAMVAESWDDVPVPEPKEGTGSGFRDEKKIRLLEDIHDMTQRGFLNLVLPPGETASVQELPSASLPSKDDVTPRDTALFRDLLTGTAVDAYAGKFLTCYTDKTKERPLLYEQEYIIGGHRKDEDNLNTALLELVGIREALNFVHIMSDAPKRTAVRELALSLASAAALPALAMVLEFLIIGAWAFVEAVMDLRLLLEGKKAALFKTSEDWMIRTPAELFTFAVNRADADRNLKECPTGFTYGKYLQLLMFVRSPEERDYRIMDIIQTNLRQDDPHFSMKHCLYGLHAEIHCESRRIFLTGISGNGHLSSSFSIEEETVKAY